MDAAELLGRLPEEARLSDGGLELIGFLVRSASDRVTIVAGGLCLSFPRADVLDAEERPLPDGVEAGASIPVRLRFRAGARLLAAGPADLYKDSLIKGQLPFAFSARRAPPSKLDAPQFQKLEQQFRERHGLAE